MSFVVNVRVETTAGQSHRNDVTYIRPITHSLSVFLSFGMTGVNNSSTGEQTPLLLSRLEEGIQEAEPPIPTSLYDSSRGTASSDLADSDHLPSTQHDDTLTTTGMLLAYADNVTEAIRIVRPWAVDVSGGVEQVDADGRRHPGIKSEAAMAAFIEGVNRV